MFFFRFFLFLLLCILIVYKFSSLLLFVFLALLLTFIDNMRFLVNGKNGRKKSIATRNTVQIYAHFQKSIFINQILLFGKQVLFCFVGWYIFLFCAVVDVAGNIEIPKIHWRNESFMNWNIIRTVIYFQSVATSSFILRFVFVFFFGSLAGCAFARTKCGHSFV